MSTLKRIFKGKDIPPEQAERQFRAALYLSLTVLAFALAFYVMKLAT